MKICLLTPGQPSTNPRLVKEADTLTAAGFDVIVVYANGYSWAIQPDRALLQSRTWSHLQIGGTPQNGQLRYWFTRLRHGLSRRALGRFPESLVPRNWSLCRVTPELTAVARQIRADLYIAHNLGALPAAVAGARKHRTLAGFDIEDLHSEMVPYEEMTPVDALAARIEKAWVPLCDYLTAASPGIAEVYRDRYGVALPTTILNVFPLEERPSEFRATHPSGPLRLYWFSQTIGSGEGLEDIIAAMGLLKDGAVENCICVEPGPPDMPILCQAGRLHGVNPARIIHHPPAAPAEMVRLAAAYDVGLSLQTPTCRNHDICLTNKLFTYILAGNAVVATATEGQRGILAEIGNAGVSYEPGDVRRLADHLLTWGRDRNSLAAARRQAWDCGTRVYNWNAEEKKFLNVVESVLGQTVSCG